jgi:hypothetical protein
MSLPAATNRVLGQPDKLATASAPPRSSEMTTPS